MRSSNRPLLLSAAVIVLISVLLFTPLPAGEAPTPGWQTYGEGVTLQERTPIGDILARPDQFEGRTVAVEGRVTEVCTMMGCWIMVRDAEAHQIRLKVEDGAMVFPAEAVGHRAVLQGKVQKLTFTREEFLERARHGAKERGAPLDPKPVKPPYQEIRLWGSGALIESTPTDSPPQ